ncbi:MAG: hypothetical protein AUI55_03810 [Gemmatimonadetes bacterium 13_1_40CM_2_70_7]|nr:MAG: hypothetical protein AUI55_03810 [Gemmatimonadetes bacterium 13_1_40CM_2_70_7]
MSVPARPERSEGDGRRNPVLGLIGCSPAAGQVRPGIDVLLTDSVQLVAGKRVVLLTNHTGVDRAGRRDVDRLYGDTAIRLTALFSPEHGFRGLEDRPGLPVAVDSATRLPIYSLYGGSRPPNFAALDSADVALVDLQDIGARYYTYPATATQLLRQAARRGVRVVVLDRPDPVGGEAVQGNVHAAIADPDTALVGFLPVPMRHGMTLGELLRLANDALGLHADLVVVPAAGWRRGMYFDATGLPWIKPSPNMPDLESAFHYPGTCLFEGTNLSVGRGTPFAFQVIGAPWLDPRSVMRRLRVPGDPENAPDKAEIGVAIDTITFTPNAPTDGKYAGVPLKGLRLRVTDRARYDPTRLAVALLAAIRAAHPDSFQFGKRFDLLAAGPELRAALEAGQPARAIWERWAAPLAAFRATRAKYLLY